MVCAVLKVGVALPDHLALDKSVRQPVAQWKRFNFRADCNYKP